MLSNMKRMFANEHFVENQVIIAHILFSSKLNSGYFESVTVLSVSLRLLSIMVPSMRAAK